MNYFHNYSVLSRKNVLCLVSALLLALFIMLISYLHWLPMRSTHISINATGMKDQQALANEVRLYYVIVDDEIVTLDTFAANSWKYQGSLVTWHSGEIKFELSARRYVELALRQNPYSGMVELTKDGEKNWHNLYIKEGNRPQVFRYEFNGFLSWPNVLIGIFSCIVLYSFLYALLGKRLSPYWNEKLPLEEIMFFAGISLTVVLSAMLNWHRPFSWWWAGRPDIAAFVTQGKLFLAGLVPYKEVWDNKGPMIFFFNALGAKLWYPYGSWILEVLLQMLGFSFCYLFLKYRFSKYVAFGATLMAVLVFTPLQGGGGMTEAWSLPFIFMAACIFLRAFKNGGEIPKQWIVLCGAFCAIVLLFRVNIAILWCAAVPILIVNQIINRNMALLVRQTGWFTLGFACVLFPVCVYFLSQGAFRDMIDATILFNIDYAASSNRGLSAQLKTCLKLFSDINFPYLKWIIITGFLYPFIALMHSRQNAGDGGGLFKFELNFFLLQAVYGVMFIPLGTMSGRPYHHYLIPGIPVFAMAAAYALEFFHSLCLALGLKNKALLANTLMAAFFCYFMEPVYLDILQKGLGKREFDMSDMESLAVTNYIIANTPEHSSYASYHGGFSPIVTMMPDRRPSPRFYYTFDHVLTPGHKAGRKNFELFMRDLEMDTPEYFAWLDPQRRQMRPELEAWLHEHYTPVEMFQRGYARLYERKPQHGE